MKTISIVLLSLVLVGALGLTGCVSQAEYNKLEADYHKLEADYETMRSELEQVVLYLAYERFQQMWEDGLITETEAVLAMEGVLTQLGDKEILDAWDYYQASYTEAEIRERSIIFNRVYYRAMDTLMNELVQKYSLWEYPGY